VAQHVADLEILCGWDGDPGDDKLRLLPVQFMERPDAMH
jgi:hypothetical protein